MDTLSEQQQFSRRRFLQLGVAAVSGLIGVALGVPLVGYFVSPALRKKKVDWRPIARADRITPGEPVQVQYGERKMDGWVREQSRASAWVVARNDGSLTVFDPRCTHLGCAYSWKSEEQVFLCPCHTGVFDINGNVLAGPPPRPLDRYENKVEDGILYIGRLIRGDEV